MKWVRYDLWAPWEGLKKNYETYYRSARVQFSKRFEQFWMISNYIEPFSFSFWGLHLSWSISDYLRLPRDLWLSQAISAYFSLSWLISDYILLSWARSNLAYLGLFQGLFIAISGSAGLAWVVLGYLGLSGAILGYLRDRYSFICAAAEAGKVLEKSCILGSSAPNLFSGLKNVKSRLNPDQNFKKSRPNPDLIWPFSGLVS